MANGLNRVELIGNLTRDAELFATSNGNSKLTVDVATNEEWYDKDSKEKKSKVTYHRSVIWGKRAEGLAPLMVKGQLVRIEGKLDNRSYEDKDGAKKYVTEIIISDVMLLGGIKAPYAEQSKNEPEAPAEPYRANPPPPQQAASEKPVEGKSGLKPRKKAPGGAAPIPPSAPEDTLGADDDIPF
jgi:single-strand DNA-binding protein